MTAITERHISLHNRLLGPLLKCQESKTQQRWNTLNESRPDQSLIGQNQHNRGEHHRQQRIRDENSAGDIIDSNNKSPDRRHRKKQVVESLIEGKKAIVFGTVR